MTIRAPDATALYNEFAIPAFDEAASLYYLRRQKCSRRFGTMTDITELDQRLKSNLDHLLYFRDAARFLSEERLSLDDESDAFVGTYLSILFEDAHWLQKILSAYLEQEDAVGAIATALAWMPTSRSGPWIKKLLSSKNLQHKYVSLRVCELLNHYPLEVLTRLANREDCQAHLPLYKTILLLLGRAKSERHSDLLFGAAAHDEQGIRDAAYQACLLNGDARALDLVMHRSLQNNETFQMFAPLLVRTDASKARQTWFTQALKTEEIALELRILAVGDYGDPRGVPWLIHYMEHPIYAPFAAYAFWQITGLDLQSNNLDKTDAELQAMKATAGDSQDEAVDECFLIEDSSLPFPHLPRIQQVWSERRKHFIPGQRYVFGHQHSPKDLGYLEFLGSLKKASVLGARTIARQELAHLSSAPVNSNFVPSQYGG